MLIAAVYVLERTTVLLLPWMCPSDIRFPFSPFTYMRCFCSKSLIGTVLLPGHLISDWLIGTFTVSSDPFMKNFHALFLLNIWVWKITLHRPKKHCDISNFLSLIMALPPRCNHSPFRASSCPAIFMAQIESCTFDWSLPVLTEDSGNIYHPRGHSCNKTHMQV